MEELEFEEGKDSGLQLKPGRNDQEISDDFSKNQRERAIIH